MTTALPPVGPALGPPPGVSSSTATPWDRAGTGRPWQGWAPASADQVAAALPRRRGHGRLLGALGGVLAALAVLFVGVAALATPGPGPTTCPPGCPRPPIGAPVSAPHVFVSRAYGFSAAYSDSPYSADASADPRSLTLTYPDLGAGQVQLLAVPAGGATPEEVVAALMAQNVPGARKAYDLPGPQVGYSPGYGASYDVYPNSGSGSSERDRVIVLATVKRGLAVVAVATGPYHLFTADPGNNDGHASPADLAVAFAMDPVVSSVLWPGDGPR